MSLASKPIKQIDGIDSFIKDIPVDYQDYHAEGLKQHLTVEEKHFWFISRRERILRAIKSFLQRDSSFLEIGAGTAYVAKGIQNIGYNVSVAEIHISGLQFARLKGIKKCYQFDLYDPPFENEFDAIGLFDVIEHLEKDSFALEQVGKMLKPGGKVFITVPAHQWLWSEEDVLAKHKRRYTKHQLEMTLKKSEFEVLDNQYFFISIIPLLWLRTLKLFNNKSLTKQKKSLTKQKKPLTKLKKSQSLNIHPIINKVLLLICRIENKLSDWLPNLAGGSLILVAQKRNRNP